MEQKCKSLRFEDRRPCLSKREDSSKYCRHHKEVEICLRIINDSVGDYMYYRDVVIKTPEDMNAVDEVEIYMNNFVQSIMYGNADNSYWWMDKKGKEPRQRGHCRSLKLSNGTLCTEAVEYGARYCRYHFIQHEILCEAYHIKWTKVKQYSVSLETVQFTEFVLRREFGYIFIVQEDFGHLLRFANLFHGMFKFPYPPENLAAIDKEFYADAEKYSAVAKKSNF